MMKRLFCYSKLVSLLIISVAIMTIASCGTSRRTLSVEEGWELIGETRVNFVRDKDEITVTSPSQFTALRFKVEDRNIKLNELTVHFQNGDKLEPSVDEDIIADQYSRDIQLSSDGRYISKIEFRYRTTGNILKGRANVLVFGKKYQGW